MSPSEEEGSCLYWEKNDVKAVYLFLFQSVIKACCVNQALITNIPSFAQPGTFFHNGSDASEEEGLGGD